MTKLDEAKSALLARIVEGDEVVDAAGAYQMLVMAECQERMTELQTRECDCPDCKPFGGDDTIEIGWP